MRIAFSEEIPVQDVITAIDGYGALRIAGDSTVKPVYLPLIPYEEPVERTFPDIPSVMAPYPGIARCRKAYAVYGEQGFRIDMHAGILRCDITAFHEVLAHGFHRQGRGDGSFLIKPSIELKREPEDIGGGCLLPFNRRRYAACGKECGKNGYQYGSSHIGIQHILSYKGNRCKGNDRTNCAHYFY